MARPTKAASTAKKSTPKKTVKPAKKERRAKGEGGLYQKRAFRVDVRTKERVPYTYFQYARDVAAENLPPGVERKRITGTGPTKAEARRKFDENWLRFHKQEAADRMRPRGKPRLTLDELFRLWQANNEHGAVSETLARKYEGYFRLHVLPHLGKKKVDQITETDLLLLFNEILLRKRKDDDPKKPLLLSTAATRNIYMALSGCLSYGVRNGHLSRSPLKAVKAPRRKAPTDDIESAKINADTLIACLASEDHPDRCRWLFQFMGLRRAERLGLAWSNIRGLDTDRPTMLICQQLARHAEPGAGWHIKKETKTNRHRTIVIPPDFANVLRTHKAAQDELRKSLEWKPDAAFADLVFLHPHGDIITLNRDNDDWHKILKQYGLPHWRGHLNRHITATWLAELDPPMPMGTVRSILGHESEAMSYYYSRTTETQQAEPMRRYGERIGQVSARGVDAPIAVTPVLRAELPEQ